MRICSFLAIAANPHKLFILSYSKTPFYLYSTTYSWNDYMKS